MGISYGCPKQLLKSLPNKKHPRDPGHPLSENHAPLNPMVNTTFSDPYRMREKNPPYHPHWRLSLPRGAFGATELSPKAGLKWWV